MNLVKSKLGIISLLIILFSTALFVGCGETNVNFNVSGTLVCQGTPIANATITTDKGDTTTTDAEGSFVFSALNEAVILTFSADGYVFKTENVAVFRETHDLVIEAEQMYTLTGRVESHGIGIPGAQVSTSGLVNLTSYTDSDGRFVINNVAGETVVKVEKENYTFESKIATISNSDLVFSGSTTVTATVSGAEGATLMVGDKKFSYANGVYTASDILLGSVVVPSLAGYHFEPSQIVVTRENANLEFTAYPIYAVTGTTTSGGVAVPNVQVSVNGNMITTSNASGEFTLSNLWGDNVLSFAHPVFNFANVSVEDSTLVETNGTFTLTGFVYDGTTPLENVFVMGKTETFTDTNGQFTLNNVELNDTITFQKDGFIINSVTITDTLTLNIPAIAQFDASLTVLCDGEPVEGASVVVNGTNYETDAYGKVNFYDFTNSFVAEIEALGYTSASASFSRDNTQITISLNKIYDATLNIHSGDIELSGATIYYNDTHTTLEANTFEISDLTEPLTIRVEVSGYNPMNLTANKDNTNLDFNLSYTVSGRVLNGDKAVSGSLEATDSAGAKLYATISAGEYTFTLRGGNTIAVNADNLDFESESVTKEATVDFYATYAISGTLSADDEAISGANVMLISTSDPELNRQTTTNLDGEYSFTNLSGEYVLFTTNTPVALLPSTYTISCGGVYNFDANGYAISGRVVNGDSGLAGVTLRAGSTTTTTNELGEFTFPLLMGNVTITAEKTGYTFNESYSVTPSDAGRTLEFTSTYRVEGNVVSGTTALTGVEVCAGEQTTTTDDTGHFVLTGLANSHTLEFSKTGYNFANESISGYENLSITGTFTLTGKVLVGSTPLDGVTISNGITTAQTNENGEFSLSNVSIGDRITAELAGYTFNNITALGYGESAEFSGTFEVSGTVKSNGRVLSDVEVKLGDNVTYTNSAGRFELTNLDEFGTMTFTYAGYTFNPVEITGPVSNLEVLATFAVNGRVTINGEGLGGVSISANGQSTTTNTDGYYTLSGLSTSGYITIEKQGTTSGYDFTGTKYFSSSTTLNFTATYYVMVSVSSGTVAIDERNISLSATVGRVEPSENGYITVRGITTSTIITARANGYNDATLEISEPTDNLHIDLTYNIILRLNGATLDNASITYTHEGGSDTVILTGNSFEIKDIVGAGTWSISRDNCQFTPNSGTFSAPRSNAVEIGYRLEYSINGRITIEGTEIGVSGMAVSFGGKTTETDENGYYELTGLYADPGQLVARFEAENCTTLEVSTPVNGAGTYNLSNVKNNDFAYWLWQKGYQNLREAAAYRTITTGEVDAGSFGGIQQMGGIKLKDSTGKYLVENINYSSGSIDASVSFTGYYDGTAASYKKLSGRGNISITNDSSDSHAHWFKRNYTSQGWTNTTLSAMNSDTGIDPTAFYAYEFDVVGKANTTISSISLDASGNYVFKFSFSGQNAVNLTKNKYVKQMQTLSGYPATFKTVDIIYTIDSNGYLKSAKVHENYTVTALGVVKVDTTGDMLETFEIFESEADIPANPLSKITDLPINKAQYEANEL